MQEKEHKFDEKKSSFFFAKKWRGHGRTAFVALALDNFLPGN